MVGVMEKLLFIVCTHCGEKDLVSFAANGLVGKCNACGETFVIQGEIVPVGFSCALDPATASRPVTAAVEPRIAVRIAPAPEPIAAPAEATPAAQPVTASNRPAARQRPRWMSPVLYLAVAALVLVALIVGRGIVAPGDSAAPQGSASAGTLSLPLSESNNGYAWNQADYPSRMALCQTFARNSDSKPGQPARDAKWFYDAIHSFYNSNPQAPILRLEISQPVKLSMLTDKAK
jgi:hypothetical protein